MPQPDSAEHVSTVASANAQQLLLYAENLLYLPLYSQPVEQTDADYLLAAAAVLDPTVAGQSQLDVAFPDTPYSTIVKEAITASGAHIDTVARQLACATGALCCVAYGGRIGHEQTRQTQQFLRALRGRLLDKLIGEA